MFGIYLSKGALWVRVGKADRVFRVCGFESIGVVDKEIIRGLVCKLKRILVFLFKVVCFKLFRLGFLVD